MKKTISNWVIGILLILVAVLLYKYLSKTEIPTVKEDGSISGNYSIESILALNKPYKCIFEKEDGASKISATLYTNVSDVYADFTIQTTGQEDQRFNSFFLIKDEVTYTWASFSNLGYKTPVVKSAFKNATPAEQAQLVGTQDKMPYECKLLEKADQSLFEIPTSITFTDLK